MVALKNVASLKMKTRKASTYFCEVKNANIEIPPTIEINLNDSALSDEIFMELIKVAAGFGYDVDFHNGVRYYREFCRRVGYAAIHEIKGSIVCQK
jgi:hypothetical protein